VSAPGRIVQIVPGLVVLLLVGATAFGLWHLVVGGLVNANPRAGAFGRILAAVAGSALIALLSYRRRRRAV
jgi:hypothetical protein